MPMKTSGKERLPPQPSSRPSNPGSRDPRGPARDPLARMAAPPPPLVEVADDAEPEHRRFPRARLTVPFDLVIVGEDGEPRFSARLRSVNLSVSGAFLDSTFFLPMGTQLHATFQLEGDGPAIEASAQIVRQELPDPVSGRGRSGFALRFLEFFGRTEVTLAKLFVGEHLRAFAEEYLESERAKSLGSELDRVVDALAAWELQKVTTNRDLWRDAEDLEAEELA